MEVSKMEKDYSNYALLMKALADETRVKIFDLLSQAELCACTILEEFQIYSLLPYENLKWERFGG